jgi:DNA-directed RNA polymerase subunit RPC12/RpoP
MGEGEVGPQWAGSARAVFLGLREWRAAHPRATLTEIEAELDRRWAALRGQMLADLALASPATEVAAAGAGACPHCGGALRDEGARERTLVTAGQAPVTLRRDYATCTRCGYRLFPPGR